MDLIGPDDYGFDVDGSILDLMLIGSDDYGFDVDWV